MEITKVNQKTKIPKKIRVCAYARVSLEKESMLHSLSYQVSYYSNYIQKNKQWLYVGVFSDEGITGTKASRPGFQKMLDECRKGNIDLILVKSVSRFARNTVDLLNACRELKELGIDIYFEEERIHSLSYEGELLLTLRASFAQEESRSMSENIKWKIRKDMQEGKPPRNRALGYEIKNREFHFCDDEVAVVKLIFKLYLKGMGEMKIARYLNEKGYKTICGRPYKANNIAPILRNVTYTGDLLLQKTYTLDHISKKTKKNNGELPQYLVENNHLTIISKEDFNRVQEMLDGQIVKFKASHDIDPVYPFTNLIKCSSCGGTYRRRKCNGKVYYHCRNKIVKMGIDCKAQQIPDPELYRMSREVLGVDEIDEKTLKAQIVRIDALPNQEVDFVFKDGHVIRKQWAFKSRRESWTPEMRAQAVVNGAKAHKKGE